MTVKRPPRRVVGKRFPSGRSSSGRPATLLPAMCSPEFRFQRPFTHREVPVDDGLLKWAEASTTHGHPFRTVLSRPVGEVDPLRVLSLTAAPNSARRYATARSSEKRRELEDVQALRRAVLVIPEGGSLAWSMGRCDLGQVREGLRGYGGLWPVVARGGGEVYNFGAEWARMAQQLRALQDGSVAHFDVDRWPPHKIQALLALASEQGWVGAMVARKDGDGAQVSVLNARSWSQKVWTYLLNLSSDGVLTFSGSPQFSAPHRRVLHRVSAELGLWSFTHCRDGYRGVTIYNLKTFSEEVRNRLRGLGADQRFQFQPDLEKHHRGTARLVAAELGFAARSVGPAGQRVCRVVNPVDLLAAVTQRIDKANADGTQVLDSLLPEDRAVVRVAAAQAGVSARGSDPLMLVADPPQRRLAGRVARGSSSHKLLSAWVDEESEASESSDDGSECSIVVPEVGPEAMQDRVFRLYSELPYSGHRLRLVTHAGWRRVLTKLDLLEDVVLEWYAEALAVQVDLMGTGGTPLSRGLTLPSFGQLLHRLTPARQSWGFESILAQLLT
eukprot:CAMPEP_0204361130 /NCGR_PEP_ID=MMETSP0469-20131031/38593_1 /ASSEMBLY_ACC=CAM_ASM_000384 /TAXON_ID=2969 /ORGANISM="Oxyrrhis marina" /LENGTH=555 /DNA_ID=CAMNT_0051349481 /DNA_START=78 /DNA_END=1745 /DNA_ORIENTATION=-